MVAPSHPPADALVYRVHKRAGTQFAMPPLSIAHRSVYNSTSAVNAQLAAVRLCVRTRIVALTML